MADKYYSSFSDYFRDVHPWHGGNLKQIDRHITLRRTEKAAYDRYMESQRVELDTLRKGQAKTVNYSTAISKDTGVESEEERARAAALEDLERERLGARVRGMGSTSLLGGLK